MKNWFGGIWAWICMLICTVIMVGAIYGYKDGYKLLGVVAFSMFVLIITAFVTRKSWY